MSPAVLGAVQVIAAALIVFAGQWVVARLSTQANEKTAAVQEEANGIDGMDRLVKNLETRLDKVEKRADRLADRVADLEKERARDKSLIRNLWTYVVTLRTLLRETGHEVPEPPGGLDFDVPLA